MITLEQFQNMERGTIFYVCCGGNANNLVVERFHSLKNLDRGEDSVMVLTYCGGSTFQGHLHGGNGLYLNEEEAKEHMAKRAKWIHDRRTENLKSMLLNLQADLDKHLDSEPKLDYVYLDRTDEPEPEGWWYDKTI